MTAHRRGMIRRRTTTTMGFSDGAATTGDEDDQDDEDDQVTMIPTVINDGDHRLFYWNRGCMAETSLHAPCLFLFVFSISIFK